MADASRTRCASIPDDGALCSPSAALVLLVTEITWERASLRSAPASSSLAVQPSGWGSSRRPWGRRVRRDARFEAFVATAKKQVIVSPAIREAMDGKMKGSQGAFAPSTPGSSDPNAFRRSCSDPARIRQTRLAAHLRGCCWDRRPCGRWTRRAASFHLQRRSGWTCVNQRMERSDSIPLELAFEHRFSRCSTMVGHRCR